MPCAPARPRGRRTYTALGPKVARSAEEVAADSPEPTFRSQFATLLVLFIVVFLVVGGIAYWFKSQKKTVTVPTLLGMTMEQAQKAAAMKPASSSTYGPDAPATLYAEGQICSTSAAARHVDLARRAVKVKVSSGPNKVTGSLCRWQNEPDAYQAITDARLRGREREARRTVTRWV